MRKSLSHIKRGELGHFAAEDEHEHEYEHEDEDEDEHARAGRTVPLIFVLRLPRRSLAKAGPPWLAVVPPMRDEGG